MVSLIACCLCLQVFEWLLTRRPNWPSWGQKWISWTQNSPANLCSTTPTWKGRVAAERASQSETWRTEAWARSDRVPGINCFNVTSIVWWNSKKQPKVRNIFSGIIWEGGSDHFAQVRFWGLGYNFLNSFSTFFSFYFYLHKEVNAFEIDSFESENKCAALICQTLVRRNQSFWNHSVESD